MNCVAHQSPGLDPSTRPHTEYHRLPCWTDLAKTLERGRFDGLSLPMCSGSTTCSAATIALRNAAQAPSNDPLLLVPAMAAVTNISAPA
jgi:alkanesulfonate monooxygenase